MTRILAALAAVVLAAGAALALHTRSASAAADPLDPGYVQLGAWTSMSATKGCDGHMESCMQLREQQTGRPYDIEMSYYDWSDWFPDMGEDTMWQHSRIPQVTLYGPDRDSGPDQLPDIIAGNQDQVIRQYADNMKAWGHPIYFRPLIEANGTWYKGYSGHPNEFVKAWDRIHSIFTQQGADNVRFEWVPNDDGDYADYYPGDSEVDVIGVDGYNTPDSNDCNNSATKTYGPFLDWASGKGKPLMLSEIGSVTSGACDTATFIDSLKAMIDAHTYHLIGLVWFDTDTDDANNYRVDQTDASLAAWKALAADPATNPAGTSPSQSPTGSGDPTATVTVTAPGPTVTVTKPGPTVTVTKPGPTVTVTKPGPTVTKTVTATPSPTPTVTVTATPPPVPPSVWATSVCRGDKGQWWTVQNNSASPAHITVHTRTNKGHWSYGSHTIAVGQSVYFVTNHGGTLYGTFTVDGTSHDYRTRGATSGHHEHKC